MRKAGMHRERGQASVELVALLPLIALLAVGGVQMVAALNAWSAAHEAARAGARAELVGVPARDAVRSALLGAQARGLHIESSSRTDGTHRVRVRSTVPRLLPWLPVPSAASQAEARP
jgi:hypothetical protein